MNAKTLTHTNECISFLKNIIGGQGATKLTFSSQLISIQNSAISLAGVSLQLGKRLVQIIKFEFIYVLTHVLAFTLANS